MLCFRHFALTKRIDNQFIDPVSPGIKVTSKPKTHAFELKDAYHEAYSQLQQQQEEEDDDEKEEVKDGKTITTMIEPAAQAVPHTNRPKTMVVRQIFGVVCKNERNDRESPAAPHLAFLTFADAEVEQRYSTGILDFESLMMVVVVVVVGIDDDDNNDDDGGGGGDGDDDDDDIDGTRY